MQTRAVLSESNLQSLDQVETCRVTPSLVIGTLLLSAVFCENITGRDVTPSSISQRAVRERVQQLSGGLHPLCVKGALRGGDCFFFGEASTKSAHQHDSLQLQVAPIISPPPFNIFSTQSRVKHTGKWTRADTRAGSSTCSMKARVEWLFPLWSARLK